MEPICSVYSLGALSFLLIGTLALGVLWGVWATVSAGKMGGPSKGFFLFLAPLSVVVILAGWSAVTPRYGNHIVIESNETVVAKGEVSKGWLRIVTTVGDTIKVRDIYCAHPEDFMIKKLVVDE